MGNVSFFIGCASREAAEAFARKQRPWRDAPLLSSGKYIIPSFWLAAFGSGDCVVIPGVDGSPGFTACIASSAACVERLQRRREAILEAFGEHLGPLYDAWVRLVADRFPATILMHTEEMFWMMPFADADATLRRVLAAHEAAESGRGFRERGALDGFSAVTTGEDDLEQPYLFVGWGERWPPETPRAPRWEDASIAEICARLAQRIPEGLHQRWLDLLPEDVLDVLWVAGEHEQVYSLARMRDFRRRAETLAWYAALDPVPERARAVAREALSLSSVNLQTLATVPLDDPGLARQARRAAKGGAAKMVLAIRLDGYEPTRQDAAGFYGETRTLIWALAAARAGEQGRRADAEAALEFAFADDQGPSAALLWAFRAYARCGAWTSAIRLDAYRSQASYAAIDEARRSGDEALRRLRDRCAGRIESMVAVCLDEEPGREPADSEAEARLQGWYEEGLITGWELQLGLARMRCPPREAPRMAMLAVLTDALADLRAFAGVIAAACGPHEQDEAMLAGPRAALAKEVTAARTENTPSRSLLRRVRKASRALADAGDAATVRSAVDDLEKTWGPAGKWPRAANGGSRASEWTIEILAAAAGRSQDAAQLIADLPHPTDLGRACVAVGLARDGSLDEARIALARLVADPPAPETLPLLAALAVTLDPASSGRLRDAAMQEAAALPVTRDEVAAWLQRAR